MYNVATLLRTALTHSCLSVDEVARAVHLSRSTLVECLKMTSTSISPRFLEATADVLGIQFQDLMNAKDAERTLMGIRSNVRQAAQAALVNWWFSNFVINLPEPNGDRPPAQCFHMVGSLVVNAVLCARSEQAKAEQSAWLDWLSYTTLPQGRASEYSHGGIVISPALNKYAYEIRKMRQPSTHICTDADARLSYLKQNPDAYTYLESHREYGALVPPTVPFAFANMKNLLACMPLFNAFCIRQDSIAFQMYAPIRAEEDVVEVVVPFVAAGSEDDRCL